MFDMLQPTEFVPYTGQTAMHLTIAAGLAHARVVIDPAATDLIAVETTGMPPQILATGTELVLTWRRTFGDWFRDLFTMGLDATVIVLHPAVAWTIAIRGGLARVDLDLAAGTVSKLDIAGGCSQVLLDLPSPSRVVPVRISGGASQIDLRRPAQVGVELAISGGVSDLQLDRQRFGAIGGHTRLDAGDVRGPHYALSIAGGASSLAIA